MEVIKGGKKCYFVIIRIHSLMIYKNNIEYKTVSEKKNCFNALFFVSFPK